MKYSVLIVSERQDIKTLKSLPSGVEVVVSRLKGISKARNDVARRGHGDLLVFLDDDIAFSEDFLNDLVNFVGSTRNVFVALGDSPSECVSRVLVVKKKDFFDIGGFDENIRVSGEDWDFGVRAQNKGYVKVLFPRNSVQHYEHRRNLIKQLKICIDQNYLLFKHKKVYAGYKRGFFRFFFWGHPTRVLFRCFGFYIEMLSRLNQNAQNIRGRKERKMR